MALPIRDVWFYKCSVQFIFIIRVSYSTMKGDTVYDGMTLYDVYLTIYISLIWSIICTNKG